MSVEIQFEVLQGAVHRIGVVTLNRPQALNAMNDSMILAMKSALIDFAHDDAIAAVVVRAVPGRAFCAGGDLRFLYERHLAHQSYLPFFKEEYALNRLIYHYPKPYIAFLDGMTMGGGAGISINGAYRVGTQQLSFAMPEVGIGFFPDVGGIYFLPRLPHYLGWYAGLSGLRLSCDDCLQLNLIQFKMDQTGFQSALQCLLQHDFKDDAHMLVERTLKRYALPAHRAPFLDHKDAIEAIFSLKTVDEICDALCVSEDAMCKAASVAMQQKSPTSLKVTHAAFTRGLSLDFDACMILTEQLTARFSEASDFMEGVRAVIIDKDHAPRWQPASLSEVTEPAVQAYFDGEPGL